MALRLYYLLVSCLSSIMLWRHASAGYTPLYTPSYNTDSNGQIFPDFNSTSSCSLNVLSHFLSELNFDAVNNRIVVGAADNLYLLNKDLSCVSNFPWATTSSSLTSCQSDNIGSDQNSTCRNHIRTYKAMPSNPSRPSDPPRLLVCGTQAGVTPQCRTVTVSATSIASDSPPVTASDGLVSYYPEFSGFGEFRRNGMSSDSTFFAAGFYRGTQGVGRDYNISYHNVQYDSTSQSLTLSERFSTKDSDFWLKHPVTFVDYHRADYTGTTLAGTPATSTDYQLFFVFLRESLVGVSGYDVIYSRVVRICRNDNGVNGQFSTYLKARIYCEREVPPGRDFNGAIDYQYNELQSMVFNEAGRFSESGRWVKMMYGAFSGPSIGPQGTAICAYRADNSVVTDGIAFGYNRGIFDIFRENVVVTSSPNADGTFPEQENMFVECNPSGRSATDSEKVIIAQDVKQIGEDPLVVFDGITVTQMAVDQVCVVNRTSPARCHNQDVLFLGTDNGKILKVVFVLEDGRELTPVIAEEITLDVDDDQSDDNQVRELRIESASGEKFIYATTRSKIFRLPLQRCSRFSGLGCQSCLTSRDPYCVWNNMDRECVANTLSVNGSGQGIVDSTNIWQSISSGSVSQCQALPSCALSATAIDHETIMCTINCNNTMQVTFSTDIPGATAQNCDRMSTTTTQSLINGAACIQFTGANGFNTYECRASATNSPMFTQRIMTPPGPPLQVFDDNITTEVTQTAFRVCVVVEELTDQFYNYLLAVIIVNGETIDQNFADGTCIWIRSQTPGTMVRYSVRVSNSVGSQMSPMRSVRLLDGIPGSVGTLRSNTVTNSSVGLTWMAPSVRNGDIIGYSVSVDNREVLGCAMSSVSTSYTVNGLQPFTSYSFGVRACTSAGAGESSSISVRTECGRPGRVQSLVLTPTSSSITGNWNRPSSDNSFGNIDNYEVTVVCDTTTIMQLQGTATQHTRSNISPLTYCCFTVTAVNTCNGGSHMSFPSEMCTTTLDVNPGAVRDLQAVDVTTSSILFEWTPPANYQRPGIMYSVMFQSTTTVISSSFYYANNLDPNTDYTITVQATTSPTATPASQVMTTATTSPGVPDSPQDITLQFSNDNNNLDISWAHPRQSDFNTSMYRVVWRCDAVNNEAYSSSLSHSVQLTEPLDFSWCTAKVQSINNVGRSDFSELASIVIPPMVPRRPECYFVNDNGTTVTVSFTVADPFLLDNLEYEWNLASNSDTEATSSNGRIRFDGTNTVEVPVSRNTNYSFELRLCNSEGCGLFSAPLVFFAGLDPPVPPTEIIFTQIRDTSAVISWDLPPGEQGARLRYDIAIDGPCLSEPTIALPEVRGSQRSASVGTLCPGTTYTLVIRSIENVFNIPGRFSQVFTLTTLPGSPSAPRSVIGRYTIRDVEATSSSISVYWVPPAVYNGMLQMYQVLWASFDPTNNPNCNQLQDTLAVNITDLTTLEYTALNPFPEPNAVKKIMVCVRAYTSNSVPGEWGFGTVNEEQFSLPETGGLTGSSGGDCNNLIIVAVIAGVAVLSSVIVGLVLAVVIYKNGWTLCLKEKKKKNDEVEDLKHHPTHPPYANRTNSMKPLMDTQCNGSND